ncbi:MAG: cytochrome c biogenesis protein CcsA [Verrucomicrobia bacterium]|nr:cytochrome c biogenesis protein CcsA [Verrucomicrobiota bacterium]
MKSLYKILPWLFVALFATEIVAVFLPKKDSEFHVREFGRLPVLLNGRIQPFDSVARNSLLQIRSTGDLPLEIVPSWKFWHHPKKLKATEWLLEVMLRPEQADERPIFLIHHPDLIGELKLGDKGLEKSGLRYYTFNEIRPVMREIGDQGDKANAVKAELQTPLQKQVVKLANAAMLYHRLKNSLQPEATDDFAKELSDFQNAIPAGIRAARASQEGKEYDKVALEKLVEPLGQFDAMARFAYPLIVPPLHPEVTRDDWKNAGAALMESAHNGEIHPAMKYFAAMATAYRHDKPADFNQAIDNYKQWLAPKFAKELNKGKSEFYYNDIKAFLHAMIIYICAFVLAVVALLTFALTPNFSESLRRSAFYLIILAGAVHTFGLVFRMVLEGRPPVTNLYSSAIFIGWGAMLLGLGLERIYRLGIGNVVASFAGFITLIIAHNLALGGDTMEMLRAVLDTNFWLATHVVVVTLGYASTFVAGLLAITYIFLGLFTPILARNVNKAEIGKILAKMVYAIVCFATLFSFVGTVLGGIWADQSWGRFWGWDPKENGALIIVLWNAAILHARWGGMVKERGLMNMAVFGNIVTSFSWFGVNMLGIGLHSYGFMDAAFKWLMLFVASQVVIILMGLLPPRYWASFRSSRGVAPKPGNLPTSPAGRKPRLSPAGR